MLKLLFLSSAIAGGAVLIGLGSLTLGTNELRDGNILSRNISIRNSEGKCKVVYTNTSIEVIRSDDPLGSNPLNERLLDDESKRKIGEDCKSGKTSYVNLEGGKWIYKFSSR